MQNIVDRDARLIGDVELGSRNVVEAGAIIVGPIQVGDENYFGPNCVVGAPAQDELLAENLRRDGILGDWGGSIVVGHRNVIREFATIHRGLTGETAIGNDTYLMAYSHVAHDCVIRDNAKFANSVQLGGYCWIGRGAYLGLSAAIHQFTVVGGYSMVGMGSVVTQSVPPASLLYGSPARVMRPNAVALERLGVSQTSWWEDLSAGSSSVEVPEAMMEDVREFEAALAKAADLRASVSAWRATQIPPPWLR